MCRSVMVLRRLILSTRPDMDIDGWAYLRQTDISTNVPRPFSRTT